MSDLEAMRLNRSDEDRFSLLRRDGLLCVERVLVEPAREGKQDFRRPVLLVVGQGGRQGNRLIQ